MLAVRVVGCARTEALPTRLDRETARRLLSADTLWQSLDVVTVYHVGETVPYVCDNVSASEEGDGGFVRRDSSHSSTRRQSCPIPSRTFACTSRLPGFRVFQAGAAAQVGHLCHSWSNREHSHVRSCSSARMLRSSIPSRAFSRPTGPSRQPSSSRSGRSQQSGASGSGWGILSPCLSPYGLGLTGTTTGGDFALTGDTSFRPGFRGQFLRRGISAERSRRMCSQPQPLCLA